MDRLLNKIKEKDKQKMIKNSALNKAFAQLKSVTFCEFQVSDFNPVQAFDDKFLVHTHLFSSNGFASVYLAHDSLVILKLHLRSLFGMVILFIAN